MTKDNGFMVLDTTEDNCFTILHNIEDDGFTVLHTMRRQCFHYTASYRRQWGFTILNNIKMMIFSLNTTKDDSFI